MSYIIADVSSASTLEGSALGKTLLINCTSATTLDLPEPTPDGFIIILNTGTANLTVRSDAGSSICVLTPGDLCVIRPHWDAGALAWPATTPVFGKDGQLWVGTVPAARNSNAALEVNSTSGTLVLPRMTTTQRNSLATVPVGSVIFNTTNDQIEVYVDNGGSPRWEDLSGIPV